MDNPSVPTAETLPVTESTPYTHQEGVHIPQPYRPTAFPMGSRLQGTHSHRPTGSSKDDKVIGKANKNGWRTPKRQPRQTAKTKGR